jgi:hypothetical protein
MKGLAAAILPAVLAWAGAAATGCGDPAQAGPAVPDSTMIEVLVDLHLAAARLQLVPDAPTGLRDSVLALHGLDSTSFLRAMAWYEANPDAYVAVYGAVVDRLNAESRP